MQAGKYGQVGLILLKSELTANMANEPPKADENSSDEEILRATLSLEKEIENEERLNKIEEIKKRDEEEKKRLEECTRKNELVMVKMANKPPKFAEDSSDEELLQATI